MISDLTLGKKNVYFPIIGLHEQYDLIRLGMQPIVCQRYTLH